jgi:hypothetical protein
MENDSLKLKIMELSRLVGTPKFYILIFKF